METQNSPEISIILPIKKFSKELESVLSSIFKQSAKLELIIVSNDVGKEIQELNKHFKFSLYEYREGKNASRNFGSKQAKGKYLLHVDDDMVLDDNLLKTCHDFAEQMNIKAIAIPEKNVTRNNCLFCKIEHLEKDIASNDKEIEAPRFIEKELYLNLGGMDPRLDPIDEGDLKAKLFEHKIQYHTISDKFIYLIHSNRHTFHQRVKRLFHRGKKAQLFKIIHPTSHQFTISKRLLAYTKFTKLILSKPITGILMILIKTNDYIAFKLGGLAVSQQDKVIISELKNQQIFEKEGGQYQNAFYENSIGGEYVDIEEKKIVSSYLHFLNGTEQSALDVGAGGGRWTELLLKTFPQIHVVSYDLSKPMLDNLQNNLKQYEGRFEVAQGNMQSINFQNNSFDFILSIRAMKYAPDIKIVLQEFNRLLKEHSFAVIELPYKNFVYRLIRNVPIFGSLSQYANRIKLYGKDEIINMIHSSGFKIEGAKLAFSIPSTLYKKTNFTIFLKPITILDSLLPKIIFGRSMFILLKKVT